jgi:hypothetical protein
MDGVRWGEQSRQWAPRGGIFCASCNRTSVDGRVAFRVFGPVGRESQELVAVQCLGCVDLSSFGGHDYASHECCAVSSGLPS